MLSISRGARQGGGREDEVRAYIETM